MYRSKPRLYGLIGKLTFAVSLAGTFGGIAIVLLQPLLASLVHQASQPLWWKLVDSVGSDNFVPLSLGGISISTGTAVMAYGILNPMKMKWYWIPAVLFCQILWSFLYTYIGSAFNIASLAAYTATFIYFCRPKVRSYFEYLRSLEKPAR